MSTRKGLFLAGVSCLALLGLALLHADTRTLLGSLLSRPDPSVAIATSEADLRAAFNARPDRTRVVAWFSPT